MSNDDIKKMESTVKGCKKQYAKLKKSHEEADKTDKKLKEKVVLKDDLIAKKDKKLAVKDEEINLSNIFESLHILISLFSSFTKSHFSNWNFWFAT